VLTQRGRGFFFGAQQDVSSMNAATMTRQTVGSTRETELQDRVRRELFASGYPVLRSVLITVHEGLVTLRGTVNCYYEKQIAQTVAMRIDCVESLHNEIVVI
jgi:osmotically-inducible protein OsmY